jgi:hypothetical protein
MRSRTSMANDLKLSLVQRTWYGFVVDRLTNNPYTGTHVQSTLHRIRDSQ